MSDNVHRQDQAKEIAEAVQNALAQSNPSEQQNVTINVNYNPVYNNYNNWNYYGDNISVYSSSSNSSVHIGSKNTTTVGNNYNLYSQPLQIQTGSFLDTTVYHSKEVT